MDFHALLQVTAAMKLRCNMWTMTGVTLVDSKQHYDQAAHAYKKVPDSYVAGDIRQRLHHAEGHGAPRPDP